MASWGNPTIAGWMYYVEPDCSLVLKVVSLDIRVRLWRLGRPTPAVPPVFVPAGVLTLSRVGDPPCKASRPGIYKTPLLCTPRLSHSSEGPECK